MKSIRTRLLSVAPFGARLRRGFTFIEMMMVVGILGFVFAVFTYVQLSASREVRRQALYTQTQFDALTAIDKIRVKLIPARFQTIVVSANGRRIDFNNPFNGETQMSALEFRPNAGRDGGRIYFVEDVSDGTSELLHKSDLAEVQFGLIGDPESLITIEVQTSATVHAGYGDKVGGLEAIPYRAETMLRVRSFKLDFPSDGTQGFRLGP